MKYFYGLLNVALIIGPFVLSVPLWDVHPVWGILSWIVGLWTLLTTIYYLDKIAREEGRKQGYRAFLEDVAKQIAESRR